jgi:hypothetical protein
MPARTGPEAYARNTVAIELVLDRDVAACLRRAAAQRDTTLDYLLCSLLNRLVHDQLVDAVMDDGP